jgi:uncharacterized membrane protein YphA (DoxX/SURF4 family)
MAEFLKDFPITAWYKALLAIGAACLLVALAAQRDGLAVFFGGWCLFGIGQWINHPKRVLVRPVQGVGQAKITDVSRDAWWLGWIFEIVGILLILIGIAAIVLSKLGLLPL